jgi:hypothetical protein
MTARHALDRLRIVAIAHFGVTSERQVTAFGAKSHKTASHNGFAAHQFKIERTSKNSSGSIG